MQSKKRSSFSKKFYAAFLKDLECSSIFILLWRCGTHPYNIFFEDSSVLSLRNKMSKDLDFIAIVLLLLEKN